MKSLFIIAIVLCITGLSYTPAHAQIRCKDKGKKLVVFIHKDGTSDTLCLLASDIITDTIKYSQREINMGENAYNYNPRFINMILDSSDNDNHIIVFSKYAYAKQDHRSTPFDISMEQQSLAHNTWVGFGSWLSIQNGKGCYHHSADSSNKVFEIHFTEIFAAILESLKDEV